MLPGQSGAAYDVYDYVSKRLMHQQVRIVADCEIDEITYQWNLEILELHRSAEYTGDEAAKRREADKGDSLR